ncbi:MAG: LabA-like NYN domain-containing protein [Planctomycetota bacterium]|jgi:uncharacterized LabA/DUF88 family protein
MQLSTFHDLVKKYPHERVQIFIDASNLYKALKELRGNAKIDYGKFAKLLTGERKLIRTNIYLSTLNPQRVPPAKIQNDERFRSVLYDIPFMTVKTRPLRYKPDNTAYEKGIDILLATDMLSQAYVNGYDSMILVSGDGDYAPVLEEIKKMGKRVENAFFKSIRSDALRRVCDVFISLDAKKLPKQ